MQSKMGPIQMLTLEQELDLHLSSLERKRGQRLSGSPGPRVKRKEQQRLESRLEQSSGGQVRVLRVQRAGCGRNGQRFQNGRYRVPHSLLLPHPARTPANFCLKDPFPSPSPTA